MKSKAAKICNILFLIDAVAILYYATTFPIDGFDPLSIIIIAIMIIALFALACFAFLAQYNLRKKLLAEYVPLRNISIEEGKEVVLIKKGATTYVKEPADIKITKNPELSFAVEPEKNVLPEAKVDVALVHIDQVDKKQVTVRIFKNPVALIDVAHHINK